MRANKIVLTVPPSTNGYGHLKAMKLFDKSGSQLVVSAKSNANIGVTLTSGELLTCSLAGSAYSGYPLYHAFATGSSWWCSSGKATQNWTMNFPRIVNLGTEIFRISWLDSQTMRTTTPYTLKVYLNDELKASYTVPVIGNGGSVDLTQGFYIVAEKNGKHYYLKG